MICDNSTGTQRPYIPQSFRFQVFEQLHSLAHPGVNASQRLVSTAYVWPKMRTDIRNWTRSCLQCQRSKVQHHNKAPPATFAVPDVRFDHIHVDIVGPLPPSKGYNYLLTCVDRFTRWAEAIPISDITAKTVAHAFLSGWIARFGIPSTVTTDRGAQFESNLWSEFMHLLGSVRTRTTSYHPAANGMVERFHRQLKAALKCHNSQGNWVDSLPLVMLGIRTALKSDLGCSSAELVYGTTLRIPDAFYTSTDSTLCVNVPEYVNNLKAIMSSLRPVPPRKNHNAPFQLDPELQSTTHVFIRQDGVRKALQHPYKGPFRVLSRTKKYFSIDVNGRQEIISIDRLKSAHVLPVNNRDLPTDTPETTSSTQPLELPQPHTTTRSGRKVRFPDRLTS